MNPIPFNRPYMTGGEIEYIRDAKQRNMLAGDGWFTKQCHQWLELHVGAEKALLTHSCTAALEMAALLVDIQPGDEVIMVELSGLTVKDELNPTGDIEFKITGMRPGEKLYEELLIGDNPITTQHPRIMKAQEQFLPWATLEAKLNTLEIAVGVNDVPAIKALLTELVTGYQSTGEVVDWVYLEQVRDTAMAESSGR